MKVLVIGSGGREHALVWKLSQSPKVQQIYCAPGNDGIGKIAQLVPLAADDLDGLLDWARNEAVDLTVVGPEVPLTRGIVDRFQAAGLRIFGPERRAAQLEGSKAFAKELMQRCGIPTAAYRVFTDADEAKEYARGLGVPLVVKADGLAAGKGVVVAQDMETALEAIGQMMEAREFGEAGGRIVIEEFLQGVELSLLALVDGKTVLPLAPAHDHKAVYDGDQGPNTGGMGAFSPSHVADAALIERIQREVLEPTVAAMTEEGICFTGVLFAGLMLTESGPKVLEFNARFGDPETQTVLPRLENDLVDLLEAVIDGRLAEQRLVWKSESAVTVILAAGGYPMTYAKGDLITGLNPETGQMEGTEVIVFHAGTRFVDGRWLTNGGRVLALTALGQDFAAAQRKAYEAAEQIRFSGRHFRRDIGKKALST